MIRAALFDRDGTLIADGAGTLTLMRGAVTAIARLRAQGLRIGVVTNQPRVKRDDASLRAMEALHERIEARIGKIDGWFVCTHSVEDACTCRKPQPGLILQAAHAFGVAPHDCVVIGDIGSDMEAASQAGAYGILVPTAVTRREEVAQAPVVCRDLFEAADRVIGDVAA